MVASGHFQDSIEPPSAFDIVVLIVWSRLGTPLPVRTKLREYRGMDGRAPVTGTEWELRSPARRPRRRAECRICSVYRSREDARVTYPRRREPAPGHRAAGGTRPVLDTTLRRSRELSRCLHRVRQWCRVRRGVREPPAQIDREAHYCAAQANGHETGARCCGRRRRFVDWSPTSSSTQQSFSRPGRCLGEGDAPAGGERGIWSTLSAAAGGERLRKVFAGEGGHCAQALRPAARLLVSRSLGALFSVRAMHRTARISSMRWHANWRPVFPRTRACRNSLGTASRSRAWPGTCAMPALTRLSARHGIRATHARRTPGGGVLEYESTRLVLVLDQLEELFTNELLTSDERRHFITLVAGLVRSGQVWVIATMRKISGTRPTIRRSWYASRRAADASSCCHLRRRSSAR